MTTKALPRLSIALALLLAGGGGASAQTGDGFELSWFSIYGGGGISTGGAYSLRGTIGQSDAGMMTGGNFQIAGGFWGLVAPVQAVGAPLLTLNHSGGGTLTICWPLPANGFVLDQTSALDGAPTPWAPVAFPYHTNATHITVSVPAPAGNRFYRLRHL